MRRSVPETTKLPFSGAGGGFSTRAIDEEPGKIDRIKKNQARRSNYNPIFDTGSHEFLSPPVSANRDPAYRLTTMKNSFQVQKLEN